MLVLAHLCPSEGFLCFLKSHLRRSGPQVRGAGPKFLLFPHHLRRSCLYRYSIPCYVRPASAAGVWLLNQRPLLRAARCGGWRSAIIRAFGAVRRGGSRPPRQGGQHFEWKSVYDICQVLRCSVPYVITHQPVTVFLRSRFTINHESTQQLARRRGRRGGALHLTSFFQLIRLDARAKLEVFDRSVFDAFRPISLLFAAAPNGFSPNNKVEQVARNLVLFDRIDIGSHRGSEPGSQDAASPRCSGPAWARTPKTRKTQKVQKPKNQKNAKIKKV